MGKNNSTAGSLWDEVIDFILARGAWDEMEARGVFAKIANSWIGKIPFVDAIGLFATGWIAKILSQSGHSSFAKISEGLGDFFQRIRTAKRTGAGTSSTVATAKTAPAAAAGFFEKVLKMQNSAARSNLLSFVSNLAEDRPQTAIRFQGEIGKLEPAELDDLALSLYSLDEIAQAILALYPEKPDRDWAKNLYEPLKKALSGVGGSLAKAGKATGEAIKDASNSDNLEKLEEKTKKAADLLCPWRWRRGGKK